MSSIESFFNPKSMVIVGASRTPGKIGYELLRIMVENSQRGIYKGKLFAVNPKSDEMILGVPTYNSVLDIPETPDLAVLVTPAKYTPPAMEECGKKGIKNVIVISGGFAEVGGEGVELQKMLESIKERYRMRVIGPNCVGVVVPSTGVDTMFLPVEKEFLG
ncbi:MAG: CoA-binding protein, partial [Candidatus Korarchaeota archaeon]|nr:CoA-binding protein [Candidatus Korarchaeota archaeon]